MAHMQAASAENIRRDIENLNQFNATPGDGITRILFTDQELKAREYIKKRMEETGLEVKEDAIGNIFGTLKGSKPNLAPVWTGSHIDTVPHAGSFDGMTGVVGGLEALRIIKESGNTHSRNIQVIVFTSEEPTRFGKGCLGSRALAGDLTQGETTGLSDETGMTLAQVLDRLGYDKKQFPDIKKERGDVHGCVELHIEQGAVLENIGKKTGVVTAISAPTDLIIEVEGTQEHAGATPMPMRKDAMTAAARMILKIEELARTSDNPSTVATVGKLDIFPGATNVIPGKVKFTVDMRSDSFEEKEQILHKIQKNAEALMEIEGVRISVSIVSHEHPASADKHIVDVIRDVCQRQNKEYNVMVSGAYHDSMFVSRFAPFSMIFVPSRGGISHHKDEWTDYEDIASGVDVLAETLLIMSNEEVKQK